MWNKAVVWGWVAILLITFVYELVAVLDKNPSTPSLTQTVIRYSPWWITMPFLTWLWLHFLVRYWKYMVGR
jgi:hypothetical protein